MSQVTRILERIERGDPHAADELLPLVYDELRRLARQMMAHEKPGQTLQPTALVHEAWLRLVAQPSQTRGADDPHNASAGDEGLDHEAAAHRASFANRRHFFAAAAEAMRRILVENARRKGRLKRGGGQRPVPLRHDDAIVAPRSELLLDLDEALDALAENNQQEAELVKLRYFAGLTLEQAAQTLGISRATASRRWAYARAWLYERLHRDESSG